MATLKINNSIEVKGKVSFSHSISPSETDEKQWTDDGIMGTLVMHKYIDDIDSIESDRYLLTNCTVYKESFGSDDFDIVYNFIAESCVVKDDPVDQNKIKEIENKKYDYESSDIYLYGLSNSN